MTFGCNNYQQKSTDQLGGCNDCGGTCEDYDDEDLQQEEDYDDNQSIGDAEELRHEMGGVMIGSNLLGRDEATYAPVYNGMDENINQNPEGGSIGSFFKDAAKMAAKEAYKYAKDKKLVSKGLKRYGYDKTADLASMLGVGARRRRPVKLLRGGAVPRTREDNKRDGLAKTGLTFTKTGWRIPNIILVRCKTGQWDLSSGPYVEENGRWYHKAGTKITQVPKEILEISEEIINQKIAEQKKKKDKEKALKALNPKTTKKKSTKNKTKTQRRKIIIPIPPRSPPQHSEEALVRSVVENVLSGIANQQLALPAYKMVGKKRVYKAAGRAPKKTSKRETMLNKAAMALYDPKFAAMQMMRAAKKKGAAKKRKAAPKKRAAPKKVTKRKVAPKRRPAKKGGVLLGINPVKGQRYGGVKFGLYDPHEYF